MIGRQRSRWGGAMVRSIAPLLLLLWLTPPPPARAELQYDAILEWNGPYFRVVNSPTVDQLVDDPAVEIPFSHPMAVAAREHGTGERDVVYVLDTANNRVQIFEANGTYLYDNRSHFTWKASGVTPAALEYDHNQILPAQWKAVADHWIIPFSEVVEVNGVTWRWVADLTGRTAAEHVYRIDYADAASAPEILFPDNSLADGSSFYLRYAMTDNQGAVTDAFGVGDVDYGLSTSGTKIGAKIDQSSGGPASWQWVRSIALIETDALSTSDDTFLLDAADNSAGQNEKLFYYTVSLNGTVTPREAYDDVLTTPYDVAVARSGASTGAVVTVGDDSGPFDQGSASVRDASQVTGHTYQVSVAAGSVTITDRTTNRILVDAAAFADLADPFLGIPGVSLPKNGAAGTTGSITTTRALPNRFLFVADTGANRIKVITAHGATPTATNDWLPGDIHTSQAQPTGAGTVGATADRDYDQTTPATVPEDWSAWTTALPLKEGTLATITFDPAGTPDVWTRVDDLSGQPGTAKVYQVDWTSGRILFGDNTHGAVPPASKTFSYTYATTPDLLRAGSVGSSNGSFSGPKGAAARWNPTLGAYDVYVADSGNNRIQKFAFHPPDPGLFLPARLEYVTKWKTASSSAGDTLKAPVKVCVALDGSVPPAVYLAVADQGNKRIVLYRDTAAMTGGGASVPAYVTALGGSGTTLGYYQKIEGLTFLADGSDLDIFAADSTRGVVTKYKEAPGPTIALSYGGLSALPNCFSPSDSYLLSFSTTNPPAGGWIDFYYDTASSFNISTSKLCITSGTITATASSASWVFASTPHTPPPPQAPPDNAAYYIFARLKDSSGNVVAQDQTSGDRLLCLDSSLTPSIAVTDVIDGDATLYLQNGLERVVALQVAYPESLVAAGFSGTFDTTLVQIQGITPGEGWDGTGAITHFFNESHNNTAGTFLVTTSVAGAPSGLNGAGPYTLARMRLKAKGGAITSAHRFRNGTLSLIKSTSGLTSVRGTSPSSWQAESMNLRLAYLGDIATTGSGADGAVPHFAPKPDGKIDFWDQMVFTVGWNGSGNVQDRVSDIGPATGPPPHLISSPDGQWNVDDLLAFTSMFSWAAEETAQRPAERGQAEGSLAQTLTVSGTGPPPGGSWCGDLPGPARLVSICRATELHAGGEITLDLRIEEAQDLTGVWVKLSFDPRQLSPLEVEAGDFLQGADGSLFFHREGADWLEISASRLDRAHPGVSGEGLLAHLRFRVVQLSASTLELRYDFRSSSGAILSQGLQISDPFTGEPAREISLSASPNPAPGAANILFTLAEPSPVDLELFDVVGRRVRSLVRQRLLPGYHVVSFDGRNDSGEPLGSGVYLYKLTAGQTRVTRKLILTR
jgi:hypothetical protein